MRKMILATVAAFALSTGAAMAGGPGSVSMSLSGSAKAGNNGSIGSGAYSKTQFGTAYSIGKSSVNGSSYSTVCGGCESFTTADFDSVSSTETFHSGSKGFSEAYGFNEMNWKTNVQKSGSFNFDWGGYGY